MPRGQRNTETLADDCVVAFAAQLDAKLAAIAAAVNIAHTAAFAFSLLLLATAASSSRR